MKRVGFVMAHTPAGWTGGLNYYSNLLHAILTVPGRKIEPVLIVPNEMPASILDDFPGIEVVRTAMVSPSKAWKIARQGTKYALGHDFWFEHLLRAHDISLLSHSGGLGRASPVPTVGWLPDFQHVRLPEFFSERELVARDKMFRRITEDCSSLVLSSLDAQRDLSSFAPDAIGKSRVLHFVCGMAKVREASTLAELKTRFDLNEPYFHLPNQFWAHKNHRLVINALAELKSRGQPVLVVATGHTADPRRPKAFEELMRHAATLGVADRFRVLGLVSKPELLGLMDNAVAIVNPSLFEGWSTTVEESKSLGKKILLSDIPVHREQAPERAVYFSPDDPKQLADALLTTSAQYEPAAEPVHRQAAAQQLPKRLVEFGLDYQRIALQALAD
ncbi:glycosyltransferase family 1 protein [soil metagenome]